MAAARTEKSRGRPESPHADRKAKAARSDSRRGGPEKSESGSAEERAGKRASRGSERRGRPSDGAKNGAKRAAGKSATDERTRGKDARGEPARPDAGKSGRKRPAGRDRRPKVGAPPVAPATAPRVHPTKDARARERIAKEGPSEIEDTRSRSGTVALVGRPNVGKSTILNAALQQPLAIVTSTPQTTRDTILGVVHVGNAEVALLDTPGLHKAQSALSRAMNRSARNAARGADLVVFVTDIPERTGADAKKPLRPHPGDVALLSDVGAGQPTVLVINKVDRTRDKEALLPLIDALSKVRSFDAIVPISARKEDGIVRVLAEVAKLLPEGEHRYGPDDITDRPTRFFAGEYVREQILLATKEEVPHATAVTIEAFEEKPKVMRISATIHVERAGQKKILVGAGGQMLREIGTRARARIEELIECPVFLELFVRVTPGWRESRPLLEELGYGAPKGEGAESVELEESE